MREVADGCGSCRPPPPCWRCRCSTTTQHARLEAGIAELQRRADLLAIHTVGDVRSLTPFARAAGRRLLVVEGVASVPAVRLPVDQGPGCGRRRIAEDRRQRRPRPGRRHRAVCQPQRFHRPSRGLPWCGAARWNATAWPTP